MNSKGTLEMVNYLALKNVPIQVIAELLDLQIREIKNLTIDSYDLENKELTEVIKLNEWLKESRVFDWSYKPM